MPLYEIAGPDGKNYQIEGPEGASRDEVIWAIKQRLREQERQAIDRELEELRNRPAPPPETTFGGNVKEFFKGIVPGAANLGESGVAGLASILPDEQEDAVRGVVKGAADSVREQFAPAAGYENSFSRRIGEGLGSTLPFFALAPFGIAGAAAGTGLGIAAGAGEARMRAESEGATSEQRTSATMLGAPTGALDMLAPGVGQAVVGQLRRILFAGGIEAATEASQSIAQNLIARGVYKPEQEVLEGLGEAATTGGAVGALAQALMDAVLPRRRGGATPDAEEGETPLGAPPAPPAAGGIADLVGPPAPYDMVMGPPAPADMGPPAPPAAPVEDVNAALREAVTTPATPPPAPVDLEADPFPPLTPREPAAAAPTAPGQPELQPEPPPHRVNALAPGDVLTLRLQGKERQLTVSANDGLRVQGVWDDGNQVTMPKARLAALMDTAEVRPTAPAPETTAPAPVVDERQQLEDAVAPVREDIKKARQGAQPEARLPAPGPAAPALDAPKEIPDAAEPVVPASDAGVPGRRGADDLAGADRGPDGAGAPSGGPDPTGELTGRDAAGAEAPSPDGLGDADAPVAVDQAGDGAQPPALEQPTPTTAPVTPTQPEPDYEAAKAKAAKQAADAEAGTVPLNQAYAEGKDTAERGGGAEVNPYGDTPAGESWQSGFIETKFPSTKREPTAETEPKAAKTSKTERSATKPVADKEVAADKEPEAQKGEAKDEPQPDAEKEVKSEEESAPVKKRAPAGRVEPTGPTAPAAKTAREDSDKRGITEEIEEAFSDGSTVAEAQKKLGKKLGFLFPDQRTAWLTGVRNTLGIPYRTTPEGKKKFDSWKADYDARQRGEAEPSAAKKERAAKVKSADSGRALVDPVKLARAKHTYVAVTDGSISKALEYLGHDIASSTIDPAKNPGEAQLTLNKLTDAIQAKSVPAEMFSFGKASEEFPGMRGKFAKEFYESLTPEGRLELAKQIADYMRADIRSVTLAMPNYNLRMLAARSAKGYKDDFVKAEAQARVKKRADEITRAKNEQAEAREEAKAEARFARRWEEAERLRETGAVGARGSFELADLGTLLRPLHPHARDLLAAGNLRGALMVTAEVNDGLAGQVARKLADVVGTTTVKVEKNLKNAAGQPVPGLFDPQTNTITLDAETGMDAHPLLHEATHAATHATLANKSHPLTKQLTNLYNAVRGQLDTTYGAQSLDEFVAEAFSNPEFQQKLASMLADGRANTVWNRFTRAVANFVRRLMGMDTKPTDSALDRADSLISAILAPSPASVDAGVLYAAAAGKSFGGLFDTIGKRKAEQPEFSKRRAAIQEVIVETPKRSFRELILATLPSNSLADLAKKYLPMAPMFDKLIELRKGSESKRNAGIEAQVRYMQQWANANPKELATLRVLVADTTTNQVDPSKPASAYAGQKSVNVGGRDVDKEAKYAELREMWDSLSPQGRSVYKQMRDGYAALYADIKRIVLGRIEEELGDRSAGERAVNAVWEKLMAKANLDPYFALTRRGKYWLSYNVYNPGTDSTEHVVEAFETAGDRKFAADYMKKNGATDITSFAQITDMKFRNAPPTSFVNDVLKTIQGATATKTVTDPTTGAVTKESVKLSDKTTDDILQLFLTSLPETAFAQAFRNRKGTPGFEVDPIHAYYNRALSISHQLGALEYAPKLNNLLRDMNEHVKRTGQDEVAAAYLHEYSERVKIANNPTISQTAQLIRSFGFGWTLGFNVSSALVNTSQIPLVVVPVLGGDHGFIKASRAVASATKIFMGSGFNRDIEMFVPSKDDAGNVVDKKIRTKAAPSLDNYDFDDPKTPAEVRELKPLMELARDRGQLNRSLTYDILDIDENASARTKISAMSGIFMHHAERMNRQITMIAAYKLKLDEMRSKGQRIDDAAKTKAAEYALYTADFTNGSTTAASAPRIAQNNLGSIMFMYKKYGVAMYAMLAKTTHEMFKGESPEVRQAAFKKLVGIFGSAAAMAGVKGIPMFGVAMMVFNLFLDEDEDDAETLVRKYMGETLYSGLLNDVTGVDVASRIGLSDLIFREQRTPEAENAIQGIINQLGGPVLGTANRVANGMNLVNQGFVQRGIEQMLPASVSSAFKAFRYNEDGVLTLRGDKITDDLNFGNIVAQSIGFAPADYIAQLEKNADLKGIERASVQERTKLLRTFYVASRTGDSSTMQDALAKMMTFNRKHPSAAISADTIKRSMAQHAKTSAEMYNGVTLNKALRPELYGLISEYDADD